MNKEFGYPAYGPDSVQVLTTVGGPYADALMDTSIRHLPGAPWRRGPNLPQYQWLEKQP